MEKKSQAEWESRYEELAPSVDFRLFAHPDWEQPYMRRLKRFSVSGQRAFEFGSGKGGLSLSLKRLRPEIEAFLLDYSLAAVRLSKSLHAYYNVSANFICGSFLDLPFKAGSFDLIHGQTVLEHVVHTERALGELARVLRPGGSLIATVPNRNRRIDGHDVYNFINAIEYTSLTFRLNDLKRMCSNVGLEVIETFGNALIYFYPSWPILILRRAIIKRLTKSEMIAANRRPLSTSCTESNSQPTSCKKLPQALLRSIERIVWLPFGLVDRLWGRLQGRLNT